MTTSRHHPARRFSLTELLVVAGVLAVLAALLLPALHHGKEKSGQMTCLNHLRNLGIAIQLYQIEFQIWPRGPLDEQLASLLDNRMDVFTCPATGESYDAGFVARETNDDSGYVVGCPYHRLAGFTPGNGTQVVTPGEIRHNGELLAAGEEVDGGKLSFADGSQVTLSGKAVVLASFRMGDGPLYTVLRVFQSAGKTVVDAEVTPGSRFEVVTPAAIAGVAGTQFKVTADQDGKTGDSSTVVTVSEGKVKVTGRKGTPEWTPVLVGKNGQAARTASAKDAQRDPKEKKPKKN